MVAMVAAGGMEEGANRWGGGVSVLAGRRKEERKVATYTTDV